MRLFLYEFATGGGFLADPKARPPASLFREGKAMLAAAAADFAAIPGVRVATIQGPGSKVPLAGIGVRTVAGAEEERAAFDALAAEADWTVLIAPECDGHLLRRCCRVEAVGGRLLGPGPEVVEIASDKHRTAQRLSAAGVPVPEGLVLRAGDALPADGPFPAIVKPLCGAGSDQIRRIDSPAELPDPRERLPLGLPFPVRWERYCPGRAASVAVLCGPGIREALAPCWQRLSDDGCFRYLGGSLPLEDDLARRAVRLARGAVNALPEPTGWVGIDLVLGADPTGREDVAIEVNPRLTTSYVGLRAAASEGVNLAEALLAIREARRPRLSFSGVRVEFDCNGIVRSHL